MFSKCSELKSIDLSNFILSGNAECTSLFSGCNNLIAIDFPKIPNPTMNFFVVIFDLGVQGTTSSKLQLKYVNLCPLSKSLGIIAMGFSYFFFYNKHIENFFICLSEDDYSTLTSPLSKDINFERCCYFNLDTLECEVSPTSIPLNSQELDYSNDVIDSGDDNYIIVYFNGDIDYSSFLNRYRTNVTKVVVYGKELNKEDSFTIPSDTGFEIHFDGPVASLESFFDSITDENAVYISSIDFSLFDSSRLSNMNSIFSGCSDLVTVDFTNFNWSNVKDIGYMFYACDSLKSIDLSNFDISKITNMERMFQSCDSLESVIFPESSPQNIENMDYIFYYCQSLKSVDLSKFNLSKITDMDSMFEGCYSLESVTFPVAGPQNIEDMGYIFCGCSALQSIDLSNFSIKSY